MPRNLQNLPFLSCLENVEDAREFGKKFIYDKSIGFSIATLI